jgi:hypothetical protein
LANVKEEIMKKQMSRSVVMLVVVLLGVLSVLPLQAQGSGVINLTFAKSAAEEGIWEGTVAGDVEGNLRTVLLNADTSAPVWRVEFDWIIDAGPQSFTARMSGTLNTKTGAVAMQGKVVEGWMVGAQVQEKGQLVDPETSAFEGTIRLIAPSAQALSVTSRTVGHAHAQQDRLAFDLRPITTWLFNLLQ